MTDVNKVDAAKTTVVTPKIEDKKVEEKKNTSIYDSGASVTYNGTSALSFLGGNTAMNYGSTGLNPSWFMNNSFQQEFLPAVSNDFSVPPMFAQFTMGGRISQMWESFSKLFDSKMKTTVQTNETPTPVTGPTTVTTTGADKPLTNEEKATKFEKTKEAAKVFDIPVDDKDTQETLDNKIADAKAKISGDRPEVVTTTGSGHHRHKAVEHNVNDIEFDSGAYNHLYNDKNGNRICKKYNPAGELTSTITYDKNGKLVSNVKADKKAEKAKTETEKAGKEKSAEASKICKDLFVSMKGLGTDDDKLDASIKKINKDNVLEVLQEWNKRYSSKMDGETLMESINKDLLFEDSKYIDHIKDAMVTRATEMGLSEDAQAFDAVVTAETTSFATYESAVETAFTEMQEMMEKKQK